MRNKSTETERFLTHIRKDPDSGCWIWLLGRRLGWLVLEDCETPNRGYKTALEAIEAAQEPPNG